MQLERKTNQTAKGILYVVYKNSLTSHIFVSKYTLEQTMISSLFKNWINSFSLSQGVLVLRTVKY